MSFDLFQLLPAIYRIRDAQVAQSQTLLTASEATQLAGLQLLPAPLTAQKQAELDALLAKAARGPLQSLCMLIQEQLEGLAYDLDQLYDDQFIETCAPWVIPYIGDLIGYQSVKGIAASIDNPRAEVAETISLRRRKGTVLVMEQLARDATAWGAHAVEFFEVLADTQYMNHPRRFNHYAPDVRKWQTGIYIDHGFDRTAHKVDVRRIEPRRGRYNIQNIGIFLWSLTAYSVTDALATPARTNAKDSQWCFRFSSLGEDIRLFHRAAPEGEEFSAAARPINVADRLRRRVLCDDLQKGVGAGYYGLGASLSLTLNGELLSPYQIKVADLSGKDGSWANLPAAKSAYTAVVDPELGRIALAPLAAYGTSAPDLKVSYHYGFNADVGGGEYTREDTFRVTDPGLVVSYQLNDATYATFDDALNAALALLETEGSAALEIHGSTTFAMTTPLIIDLPKGTALEIRGAAGARPTIVLDGELSASGDEDTTLILNGLLITAGDAMKPISPTPAALVHMPLDRPDASANGLGNLTITDCTLVPGWSVHHGGKPRYPESPALLIEPEDAQVSVNRSIVGAVRTPELATLTFNDSVIDATDPTLVAYSALDNASGGGALTLTGCTVIGKVHASVLTLVSDSILWGSLAKGDAAPWVSALIADRKQQGCVRFSFLPYEAVIPRHFECVFRALASAQPYFFSLRYGKQGYCKLLNSTDDSIRRGADDGGEMGVFHFLLAPQRESDLAIRMQEYMPVGLEYGLIYQN